MTSVSLTQQLPVPAQTVWATIGGFNALPDWHPAVEKSELDEQGGITVRKLSLAGGGTILEKLEQVDENERVYSYSIMESPLPVASSSPPARPRTTPRRRSAASTRPASRTSRRCSARSEGRPPVPARFARPLRVGDSRRRGAPPGADRARAARIVRRSRWV